MLAALCVVIGYAFALIPNIEMMTASIFISGYITGPLYGSFVGAIAIGIYSMFNPYGSAIPPLLVAQMVSMGCVGFTGGFCRKKGMLANISWLKIVLCACAGFLLTLLYDFLTTISSAYIIIGTDTVKLLASFIAGIAFYLTHWIVNTIIFATIVPLVIKRLNLENEPVSG